MRRHPSEFYVKYLLARSWRVEEESIATVNDVLVQLGFPEMTEDVFDRLRATFEPPANFKFSEHKHKDTKEFMEREQLSAIWNPDKDERQALSLLEEPLVMETVMILLLGRVPVAQAAQLASEKWDVLPVLTERALQVFQHYFWNSRIVSRAFWHELLFKHPFKHQFLGALVCGPKQALYQAGFTPTIERAASLRDGYRQIVFMRDYCRVYPPGIEVAKMLSALIKAEVAIHSVLAEGDVLEAALDEYKKFELETTASSVVPPIDALVDQGGSFSRSAGGATRKKSGGVDSPKERN